MQAEEERQGHSSRGPGSSGTALVQLRAMQRRSDLYSIELVLGPDERSALLIHDSIGSSTKIEFMIGRVLAPPSSMFADVMLLVMGPLVGSQHPQLLGSSC